MEVTANAVKESAAPFPSRDCVQHDPGCTYRACEAVWQLAVHIIRGSAAKRAARSAALSNGHSELVCVRIFEAFGREHPGVWLQ